MIVPPGPGVLCAYGDATTQLQDEATRTYIKLAADVSERDLLSDLQELRKRASESLNRDGIKDEQCEVSYQVDMRYAGQAFQITVDFTEEEFKKKGFALVTDAFDKEHEQLFTFKLGDGHEILMIRALVKATSNPIKSRSLAATELTLDDCVIEQSKFYYQAGWYDINIYDRQKLHEELVVQGPAIVLEMDSTTVILPQHNAKVDALGNLIINPNNK